MGGVIYVAGAPVTYNMLIATLASWTILLSLYFFIRRTDIGRAMQAVSMDTKGAAICGIEPDRVNLITWALSGGLGALGGVFFASYTQLALNVGRTFDHFSRGRHRGWHWVHHRNSVVAHIVGFMEVIVVSVFAPELRGVFTMGLIILVLVLRPQGLLGERNCKVGLRWFHFAAWGFLRLASRFYLNW